jgi:guanyl-specific ribonuclease Sa
MRASLLALLLSWSSALAFVRDCSQLNGVNVASNDDEGDDSRGSGRRRRRNRAEQNNAPPTVQPNVQPVVRPTATVGMRRLPFSDPERVTEVNRTLDLIESGGPFPFRQDGAVFQNRENRLPERPLGYYHEYTVVTPGLTHRGARRIITGTPPETWYTDDHYRSFIVIDPRRY